MPAMKGMNAATGRSLDGLDHLAQSITDILTTPIGSRVMRRDYGSLVPRLVDAPINRSTLMQIYSSVAEALDRWEPRLRLESVQAASAEPGRIELKITGQYLPDGQTITIDGVIIT